MNIGSPYVHRLKITVEWESGLDSGTRELTLDSNNSPHATRMYAFGMVFNALNLAAQQQNEEKP